MAESSQRADASQEVEEEPSLQAEARGSKSKRKKKTQGGNLPANFDVSPHIQETQILKFELIKFDREFKHGQVCQCFIR